MIFVKLFTASWILIVLLLVYQKLWLTVKSVLLSRQISGDVFLSDYWSLWSSGTSLDFFGSCHLHMWSTQLNHPIRSVVILASNAFDLKLLGSVCWYVTISFDLFGCNLLPNRARPCHLILLKCLSSKLSSLSNWHASFSFSWWWRRLLVWNDWHLGVFDTFCEKTCILSQFDFIVWLPAHLRTALQIARLFNFFVLLWNSGGHSTQLSHFWLVIF